MPAARSNCMDSKKYRKSLEKKPAGKVGVREGVEILKSFEEAHFDMTVELVMSLGIDSKQADQRLRGSIALPHGIGKSKRVIAFCPEDRVEAAREVGAVEAGGDDLVSKVQDGWMEFDVAVAHPSMMKNVSKLGRVLGPSGLMPSPKAGTVTDDIEQAVKEFAAGKFEYRNDDGGNIHLPVGKMSFDTDKLTENIQFFVDHVRKNRPAVTKGQFLRKVCISGTMTPSVELDVSGRFQVIS